MLFDGPNYFLTHLGLFEEQTMLFKKMSRPAHNALIAGCMLWDHVNERRYFVLAREATAMEIPDSGEDDAGGAPGFPEAPALRRSGVLFGSPSLELPDDQLGLFGIEGVRMKPRLFPQRSIVVPGGLLWDAGNKVQYFLAGSDLRTLDEVFGDVLGALDLGEAPH